jgi:hypothetical protein
MKPLSIFKTGFYLCFLCIFGQLQGKAAPGRIIGASIETNGWQMLVWIEGMATGGTFNLGLESTNKRPENARVALTASTPGFTSSGTPIRHTISLLATKQVRLPYPNHSEPDMAIEGGNLKLRVALSQFIYQTDSNIIAQLPAGIYVANGLSSSAASNVVVTNQSRIAHARPYAKWSDVPWQYVSGNTVRGRLVAFGPQPQNGQPVACVKVWASDGMTTTPTNTLNGVSIDNSFGDAVPVQEFIGDIDVSSLASNREIKLHAAVFPWRGTSALRDTDSGAEYPTGEFAPFPLFLSKDNTWIRWAARVSVGGNDSTATIVPDASFSTNNSLPAFASIGAAVNRMLSSNATHHARQEIGGSVIYVENGQYSLGGTTHTYFKEPPTWVELRNLPGHSSVTLIGAANTANVGLRTKIRGLIFANGGTGVGVDRVQDLWLYQCTFSAANTTVRTIDTVTNVFLTRSTIHGLRQGANAYGSEATAWWMVRGNDWSGWSNDSTRRIQPHLVLGNKRAGPANDSLQSLSFAASGAGTTPPVTYPCIAFNVWQNNKLTAGDIIQLSNSTLGYYHTNGLAVVMNVVEYTGNNPRGLGDRIAQICSSAQTVDDLPQENVYIWYNTFAGQRFNCGENAGGNPGVWASRYNWSVLNNIFDQVNTKHDKEYIPNGGRQGGWPIAYGVGWAGNCDLSMPIDSSWFFEFIGVPGMDRGQTWNEAGPNAGWVLWTGYVRRGSHLADGAYGSGNGDYRLRDDSAARLLLAGGPWALPYDVAGSRRVLGSPPGAYADGVVEQAAPSAPRGIRFDFP